MASNVPSAAEDLEKRLVEWEIPFEGFNHPPVYTCEEARLYLPPIPAQATKNLFVTDRISGRRYLVTVAETSRLHMKELARELGARRLSFGSEDELRADLGIGPGEVSLLALVNDRAGAVAALIDERIWGDLPLSCHPLTNTRTLLIRPSDLERFLKKIGHPPLIRRIP